MTRIQAFNVGNKSPRYPGEFKIVYDDETGDANFIFVCPCSCGAMQILPVSETGLPTAHHWDGKQLAPTLSPVISRRNSCGWYGFLKNGYFED